MSFELKSAKIITMVKFLGFLGILSVIFSIIGVSLISIALCLPHTPYEAVENPIIDKIYTEMGDFQTYYNRTSNENISRLEVRNIRKADRLDLEIRRINGTVVFKEEAGFLFFHLFNGTAYQVNCECNGITLDLSKHKFKLLYQYKIEYTITRIDGEFSEPYFMVYQRSGGEWLEAIVTQTRNNFSIYFNTSLLYFSIVGSIVALGIAFFILLLRRLGLLKGGSRVIYFILKRLRGRFGYYISKTPFIEFRGEWYLEEKFKNEIDFSRVTKIFKEIFIERWYDSWIFPTALASIIIYFLLIISRDTVQIGFIYSSPLIAAPIAILILVLYYPLIWSLDEGGFKHIIKSQEKAIQIVKSLGVTIKKIIGVLLGGLSVVVSLGSVALNLTGVAYETRFGSFGDIINTFDVIGIFMLILWTGGFFLVLMSSILMSAGLIASIYLNSYHVFTIKHLRNKSDKENIISNFGSLATKYVSESSIKYIIDGVEI